MNSVLLRTFHHFWKYWWPVDEHGYKNDLMEVNTPWKVLISICWDCVGVVQIELLPVNVAITTDIYCKQSLNSDLKENRRGLISRDGVVIYCNNSGPYTLDILLKITLGLNISHILYYLIRTLVIYITIFRDKFLKYRKFVKLYAKITSSTLINWVMTDFKGILSAFGQN